MISLLAIAATTNADELSQLERDWSNRRARYRSIQYEVEGSVTHKMGTLTEHIKEANNASTGSFPATDHVSPIKNNYYLDLERPRLRLERDEHVCHLNDARFARQFRVVLFDGANFQVYQPHPEEFTTNWAEPNIINKGRKVFSGVIVTWVDYPWLLAHGLSGVRATPIVADAPLFRPLTTDTLVVHGHGNYQNRNHLVLRSQDRGGTVSRFYEFWVDPARESIISKWVLYDAGKVRRTLDLRYKRTSEDWILDAWDATLLDDNGKLELTQSIQVRNFVPDRARPEADFSVTPVVGSVVFDQREHRHYLMTPNGPVDVDRVPRPESNNRAWFWGAFTGIGLLVAISVYWRFRTRLAK